VSSYLKTKAIIINKKVYRENDLLITVLSQNQGKLFFIAKGASSSKSNRNATLQLGNIVSLDLYQKNNFYWLSDSVTLKNLFKNRKSLNQIKFTFYFLEVLNQLVAENLHQELIFDKSISIISAIENKSFSKYVDHLINLIKILGYGIPENITTSQRQDQYLTCQKLLINYIQTIIELPLQTSKII